MGLSSCTIAEHLAAMKMRLWRLLSTVVCDNSSSVIHWAVFFRLCFFRLDFWRCYLLHNIKFLPLNSATEVCTTFSFHLKCYNWVIRKLGSHTITLKNAWSKVLLRWFQPQTIWQAHGSPSAFIMIEVIFLESLLLSACLRCSFWL